MKLYIIGNGFDLEHNLPTSFVNHFKPIAVSKESVRNFWDLYQSQCPDIWSDFENNLAHPDFNQLENIFNGCWPDYSSEHESDRERMKIQVDISVNLYESLYEFAKKADKAVSHIHLLPKYKQEFSKEDCFLSFNYTHTLEWLYNIKPENILHIHGEVGRNNLLLGYPTGTYNPEKYRYDPTFKGRGRCIDLTIEEYLQRMIDEDRFTDFRIIDAYDNLIDKVKSFYKEPQINLLHYFLIDKCVDEIIVIGHSCKIDFEYFEYLNSRYPDTLWRFNPYSNEDFTNMQRLINNIKIKRVSI